MKTTTLSVLILMLGLQLGAQCPGSITASVVTTAAACPSSGTATINTLPSPTASFVYKLTAGPAGATLNAPQSGKVFSALQAGNYTANISCGGTQTTVSFTIADNYTPISSVNAAVTIDCGTFSQKAHVNISVTGGTAPLSYSIVQSADPNYPDALSVYSSSPVKNVTSYGTYQLRVKDACNQFYTKTVSIASPLPAVQIQPYGLYNAGCGTNKMNVLLSLYDPVAQDYHNFDPYFDAGGLQLKLWELDPSGNCAPAGPLLYDTVIHTWDTLKGLPIPPSKKYYIQTITACGDTSSYCSDLNNDLYPAVYIQPISSGCTGSSTTPPVMNFYSAYVQHMVYPININIKNGSGTTVYTTTLNSITDTLKATNLPMDDYTITATDACGNADITNIPNAAGQGAPNFDFTFYSGTGCAARPGPGTTQNGTTTGFLTGWGYLPNLATATFKIIAGPSNIGVQGYYDGWGNIIWYNLLPGAYTLEVTTECGVSTYPVTVAPPATDIFMHNISISAASTCGGSGSIYATVNSTADNTSNYNLIDAGTGQIVSSGLTGDFNNIAPGNYYVQMLTSDCEGNYYTVNSNTVTISSGSGPQVAKKLGTACEDSHGNPLSTGTAYLTIAGGSPLLVEYKLTSASSWTIFSNNAPADIAIPGLQAGSVYDIRITSCGITTATQVTIERLGHITTTTALQPCDMMPYEMALPQMPGAEYQWTNPSGAAVATTYNYTIANYNSSYNGQYIGTLTWNGCLLRADTISISSLYCGGGILPLNIVSFTGKTVNNTIALSWITAVQTGYNNFIVERSSNALNFIPVSNVIEAGTTNHYSYTDNNALSGTSYYRLKINDSKGNIKYSSTVTITSGNTGKIQIQPTVTTGIVTITGVKTGQHIQLYDAVGKLLLSNKAGSSNQLNLAGLAKGLYTIVISTNNQWVMSAKIVRE